MGFPKLYFDNRFADATPTAWSTATGYDPANVADMRPYTWWKPSAMSGYYQGVAIKVACLSVKAADYALIYGHDLYSKQCYVSVEKSTDNFVTNATVVTTITPSSDDPVLASFNSTTSQYWRLLIYRINQIDTTYESQFDNAYWTKGFTTINPNTAVAPDGTTTSDTCTDADAGNSGYILRSFSSLDITRTYKASVDVLKDAVPAATRFCTLRLVFSGSTTETYVCALDTSTGAILHRNDASAGDVAVVDDTTHWRISVTKKSVDPLNTTVQFIFYPANGSGTLASAFSAATTGSCGIWKARLDVADLPSIAIAMIGEAFAMPTGVPYSFDPLGRDPQWQLNLSEKGLPLGKNTMFEEWQHPLLFRNVLNTWLRATFIPAWKTDLRDNPFMLVVDPDNFADEIYLVSTVGALKTPSSMALRSNLQFNVKGVALP